MRNISVSVAMCTYNGERYLEKQLESIADQDRAPDEMIVCDDGSSDNTVELLRRFAARAKFPIQIDAHGERLGVVRNFERALKATRGQYIALADQDDVWVAGRLSRMSAALQRLEMGQAARPALVHTDLTVIDGDDRPVAELFFRLRRFRKHHPDPLRELLAQNYVTGCASIFNRAALDFASPFPERVFIHDWWLALTAASSGLVETQPWRSTRYRVHDINVIGAARLNWQRYLKAPGRARSIFQRAASQAKALEQRLRERHPASVSTTLVSQFNRHMDRGGIEAARWLTREKIRTQFTPATMAFFSFAALGAISASDRASMSGPACIRGE